MLLKAFYAAATAISTSFALPSSMVASSFPVAVNHAPTNINLKWYNICTWAGDAGECVSGKIKKGVASADSIVVLLDPSTNSLSMERPVEKEVLPLKW